MINQGFYRGVDVGEGISRPLGTASTVDQLGKAQLLHPRSWASAPMLPSPARRPCSDDRPIIIIIIIIIIIRSTQCYCYIYIYYIHLQVTTIQKTEKVWAPAPLRSTNMLKNLAIYCEEKSEFASLQFGPFRDPARLVPQRLHVQHWKNLRVSCAAWIFAYDPLWGRHGRFLQDTLDEQTYGICEICLYSHGYVSVSGHDLMFHEDIYWSLWQSSVHQSPDADGNIPISFFTAQSWVPQRDVSLLGPSNQRPPVARSIKWLKIQLKINMDMDQTVNHIKVTRIPQKKNTTKWWKVFLMVQKSKVQPHTSFGFGERCSGNLDDQLSGRGPAHAFAQHCLGAGSSPGGLDDSNLYNWTCYDMLCKNLGLRHGATN